MADSQAIASLSTSISSTLSHNLRLAKSQADRHTFAGQALVHVGDKAFPLLHRLLEQKGEGHEEYLRAREAVHELISFICIPYVRSATVHSSAVALLEEQASKCSDMFIKKKLVIYANQLKKSWNELEPGGIHHAPRAIRRRNHANGSKGIAGIFVAIFFIAGAMFVFLRLDLASAIFPTWRSQPQGSASNADSPTDTATEPPVPAPDADSAETTPKAGDYCKYTDDQGVIHICNDPSKVPERYRPQMEVVPSGNSRITKVVCKGNSVLVPVTLTYRGVQTETMLLMDTGASTTTINKDVAARLHVDSGAVSAGTSIVADGRAVPIASFISDSLAVGDKRLSTTKICILPGSGGNGSEGLLGMDFFKEFHYHLDYKRGVIEWGD